MVVVAKGDVVSLIFFLPFHPFRPFYFTFQKWPLHFTSFTLALLFFYFSKMATGADGGYGEGGCSVDDPRDRRGSRTPDRRASPPEPIMSVVHVVQICPDYVPKLCAH